MQAEESYVNICMNSAHECWNLILFEYTYVFANYSKCVFGHTEVALFRYALSEFSFKFCVFSCAKKRSNDIRQYSQTQIAGTAHKMFTRYSFIYFICETNNKIFGKMSMLLRLSLSILLVLSI